MQFTGRIVDLSLDLKHRKPKITLIAEESNVLEKIEELCKVDKLSVEVKKWHKKRSLDANAYAWVLIGKIAEKMNLKKDEVYRKIVKETGVYDVVPIKNEALERYIEVWENNGLGWICETLNSKLDGYTNVVSYYGSSVYDSKEMSRLIDSLVTDCQELGIETKSQDEINNLINEWRKQKNE